MFSQNSDPGAQPPAPAVNAALNAPAAAGAPSERLSEAEQPAAARAKQRRGSPNRASFTTCPVQITEPQSWEFLAAGIDSLDVGLYLDATRADWLYDRLIAGKKRAWGTRGIPFLESEGCLILPSGKPPSYAYHLQFPLWNLFFSNSDYAYAPTPNAYLSINSQLLWTHWLPAALDPPLRWMHECGTEIPGDKPSRVDLTADFFIPGGLTFEFLEESRCSRAKKVSQFSQRKRLQSYYVGEKSSPIQLRIYDKGAEIAAVSHKEWMCDIWERESAVDVWRVEYQLRRSVLKKFKIYTTTDLIENLAALWVYCTEEFCSFRRRGVSSNISRCPNHPWWRSVIEAQKSFGTFRPLQRTESECNAPIHWYIRQLGGLLCSYAVRLRVPDLVQAMQHLQADAKGYWSQKNWREEFTTRSIRAGFDPGEIFERGLFGEWPEDFQI